MAENVPPIRNQFAIGGEHARRLKTSEEVARSLATYIVDNALPEGAVLPAETEMRTMLGVGRTTVREALRLLETQGILTIRAGPRGGPVVRIPRADDLRGALTLLLQSHRASFGTLMDARVAIEPLATAAAAERITDGELRHLEQADHRMAVTPADRKEPLLRGNEEFHRIIAAASGNILLEVFCATMVSIFTAERLGVTYNRNRQTAMVKAHEAIVHALRARDPRRAEQAMRDHLLEGMAYYQKRYPDLMRQPVRWL